MMAARKRRWARLWRAWQALTEDHSSAHRAVAEPLEGRRLLSADPISFKLVQRSQDPTATLDIGDLNHDGVPDMVTVSQGHDIARIWLGKGDGTFLPFLRVRVFNPRGVAIADFNGDGNLDFAVTSPQGNKDSSVAVFYGRGDGTFFGPIHYSTHVDAITVTSADFNGDGMPDLAFSNRNRISVMLNQGNQVFAAPVFYEAGSDLARYITSGDFNNDGAPDLAVVRTNGTVNVLLNQTVNGVGTGIFGARLIAPVGIDPQIVVPGDFNGDGKVDLAVVNSNFRVAPVSVLLGNGDGTFQPRRNYFGGDFVDGLAVGDFNGDGKLDLASTSFSSAMRVYPGNGDGTFQPQTDVIAGQQAIFLKAADLNGDGLADIVVASGGGFRVLLNTSTSAPPVGTPGSLSVNFGGGSPNAVRFRNADGILTTVSLSGPGSGTLVLNGVGLAQNGNLITGQNISIDGLTAAGTTANSTLSIGTNRKSGVVDVNTININGFLKSFNGAQVVLHNSYTSDLVRNLSFDTVTDATIEIIPPVNTGVVGGPVVPIPPISLSVTRADGMSVDANVPVRLIKVGQWISSDGTPAALTAETISAIRSAGPLAVNLTTTGGGLGSFSGPQITGGTWNVHGNIGKISAKSLVNTSITAGGSIGTISISRHKHVTTFGNCDITAASIASANLGTISFFNGGTAFGLTAQSIGILNGQDAVTDRTFVVKSPSSGAVVSSVLTARKIDQQDFLVQVI